MGYESEFYAITRSIEPDLRTLLAEMDRRDDEIEHEISILRGQIDELKDEQMEINDVRDKMLDFDNV